MAHLKRNHEDFVKLSSFLVLWHLQEHCSDVVKGILFLNSNQVSQPQIKQTIFLTFSETIYNQSRNVIPTLTTHPARLGIPSRMSDYFW